MSDWDNDVRVEFFPGPSDEERYRNALIEIREFEGKVCENFMDCDHRACNSSYTAWALADAALHSAVLFTDEEVAKQFHEAYERLAPRFNYKTRERSAVPWDDVPENNRQLMIATVREVRGLCR